jgi:hypothetical protein
MANQITEEILASFRAIANGSGSADPLPAALADAAREMASLTQASQAGAVAASVLTRTLSSPASSAGNAGGGSTAGDILSTVFRSGLGVAPLVTGLLRLFGGGDEPAPAPLVKYAAPPSIRQEAAQWGGQVADVDYDQTGEARWNGATPQPGRMAPAGMATDTGSPERTAPQVIVQVQAMDSRSFMDHSQEIARAVREAMLNSNAINDVVSEL